MVSVTVVSTSRSRISAKMDMLKLRESFRIPDGSGRSGNEFDLVVNVEPIESGRVIRVTRGSGNAGGDKQAEQREFFLSSVFSLSFSSISLSLILERPIRRELLNVFADDLNCRFVFSQNVNSYEVSLTDIQVDNFSESAVYPVMLYSSQKETGERRRKSLIGSMSNVKTDNPPFLQLAIMMETSRGVSRGPPCIKYLAFRMLEICVQLDSGSIKLLFSDLLSTLAFVSTEESLATNKPTIWIAQQNRRLLGPEARYSKADVYHAKVIAMASKVYFENLIIHPMKLRLTFVHSPLSRDLSIHSFSYTILNLLSSLAEVESMKIKLDSFIVSDALESLASLESRLKAKIIQDLQMQLASIAGSLTIIGSPLGLAHKIGSGVKAFFYEPYLGAGTLYEKLAWCFRNSDCS